MGLVALRRPNSGGYSIYGVAFSAEGHLAL